MLNKTISEYQKECHQNANDKGFWVHEDSLLTNSKIDPADMNFLLKALIAQKIALIHSEQSEALEALRLDESFGNLGEEMADTVIKIFDLCGRLDINLEKEIDEKIEKNKKRKFKHGKKF